MKFGRTARALSMFEALSLAPLWLAVASLLSSVGMRRVASPHTSPLPGPKYLMQATLLQIHFQQQPLWHLPPPPALQPCFVCRVWVWLPLGLLLFGASFSFCPLCLPYHQDQASLLSVCFIFIAGPTSILPATQVRLSYYGGRQIFVRSVRDCAI